MTRWPIVCSGVNQRLIVAVEAGKCSRWVKQRVDDWSTYRLLDGWQRCQLVTLCHPGLTYIFNFWHSGTLALSPERQSARMSEIKNVRLTWMALNTFKRNCLTPLHFKGLMCQADYGTIYARSVSWVWLDEVSGEQHEQPCDVLTQWRDVSVNVFVCLSIMSLHRPHKSLFAPTTHWQQNSIHTLANHNTQNGHILFTTNSRDNLTNT